MMRKVKRDGWMVAILMMTTALLFGCGGGGSSGSSDDTLSGTAATGAAIDGYIYVTDANGNEVNVVIEEDGSYRIVVSGMMPPFLIRAVPTSGDTQYSYAAAANSVANVTPFSTLALLLANENGDLSVLLTNWSTASGTITSDDIEDALAQVNANFAGVFGDNDVDETTYNFFTENFSANGTGFDAVLDTIVLSFNMSGGTFSVEVDGESFSFDVDIDTSGITLGGTANAGDGDWTLVYGGSYQSGLTKTDIPEITITGLEEPESAAEIEDRAKGAAVSASGVSFSDYNMEIIEDSATRKAYTVTYTMTFTIVGEEVVSYYDMTFDYQQN